MLEALAGFAAFLALAFLRVPMAFAMGLVGFAGVAYKLDANVAAAMIAQTTYETGLAYTLSVIPLFILMGNFVVRARMSEELYHAAYTFLGHRHGGLAMSTVIACAGFGAICGSSIATAATFSKVAYPSMRKFGYKVFYGDATRLDMLQAAGADPALLDPLIGSGGEALGWIGIASLVGWGLGYAGQPHILARFMAIRRVDEMGVARRVAMGWVIVVLGAAIVVGLAGLLVLDAPLAGSDSEKVFILMSTQFFHPVIAGICLSGILAAVMSTASAQLLVSSSAFAEDFYRGLFRPDAGRGELLWVGRAAVLAIAAIAFWLGLDPDSKVLSLVAWAWAGFGAAFGPAIILSLYWEEMTRNGALAGIVVGGLTVIIWPQLEGEIFGLYELVPGFALSWLAIWLVSVAGTKGARAA